MIQAHEVAVAGRHAAMLEPTSLALTAGQRLIVSGEPGFGHTALALVLGGRMRPTSGRVLLDGSQDEAALRHAVALVDTPGASDPDDVLPIATIVGEELAMAGRAAGPRHVHAWLAGFGVDSRRTRVDDLAPLARTTILAELAALRPGVRAVILTLPDRHGGEPLGWWDLAGTLAERGLGVIVQSADAPARLLDVDNVHLTRHGAAPAAVQPA